LSLRLPLPSSTGWSPECKSLQPCSTVLTL
jgi:hypothetical protein